MAKAPGVAATYGEYVHQVSTKPEVYLIDVPYKNVITAGTNCYLIRDEGESLLVDVGAPSLEGYAVLTEALRAIGVDPAENMKFFLTHLHLDHAGMTSYIVPPGAPLYLNEDDFDRMVEARDPRSNKPLADRMYAEGVPVEWGINIIRFGLGEDSFDERGRELHFVDDGDIIEVGSLKLRVVSTGGHTPGHLALFEPESRILFSGDHILFALSPGLGLRPDISTTLSDYLGNLQKVRDLDVSRLFHSHGAIEPDVDGRIDWLYRHHVDRTHETIRIVEEHPGLTGAEVIRRISWNVGGKSWDKISPIQKWCIFEEGAVILDYLVGEEDIERAVRDDGRFAYLPYDV